MKRMLMVGIGCLLGGMTVFGADAPAITQAKAVKVSGEVKVKADGQTEFAAMQEGAAYSFGSTVKTSRGAFADLELSPQNTFRIQPNSEVVLQKGLKSTVAVSLVSGSVDSKLDNFPKNMKYEVQTPLAVCGAVGTSYTVTYTVGEDGKITLSIVDSEGRVTVLGRHIKIEGAGKLKPGQILTFELTKTPAGWQAVITFTGKVGDTLKLNLWGIRTLLEIKKPEGEGNQGTDGQNSTVSTVVKIMLPPYVDLLPAGDDKHLPPPPMPNPPVIPDIPHEEASPS